MKRANKSKKCIKEYEENNDVITPEIITQLDEINITSNVNKNNISIIKLLILNNNFIKRQDYNKLVNIVCLILNNSKSIIKNINELKNKCISNEILNIQNEMIHSEISIFINNIKPFCNNKYDIVNQGINLINYYMIDKYGIVIKYKEYNTNDVYSWCYDIKHDPVSIYIPSGKDTKKNKTYNALVKQYKLKPELFTATRSVINTLYLENDVIKNMINKIISEN